MGRILQFVDPWNTTCKGNSDPMFVENETTTQIVLCLLPLELECTFCFPYIRSLSNLIYIDNLSYKNIVHFDKVKSPICHMAIPFYFHVGDNFLVIVILAL